MSRQNPDGISRRDVVKFTGLGVAGAGLAALTLPGSAFAADASGKQALFFDVGGTILDWSVMPDRMSAYFERRGITIDGESFWPAWRAKLFSYMMYNTMIGSGFMPLEDLAQRVTMAVAQSLQLDIDPDDAAGVLSLLGELDVYPDIEPGLQQLRDLDYLLVPHTQLTYGILKSALLDRFEWDWYFTSESFALYKPQRQLYLNAIDALGLERSDVIYVTSNQFDVFAAKGIGFRTAWVDRWGEPLEPYGYTPDWHVRDFVELAGVLEAQQA